MQDYSKEFSLNDLESSSFIEFDANNTDEVIQWKNYANMIAD